MIDDDKTLEHKRIGNKIYVYRYLNGLNFHWLDDFNSALKKFKSDYIFVFTVEYKSSRLENSNQSILR